MPDVALDCNYNPATHLSNFNRKRGENNSMTETRRYLNSINGYAALGYRRTRVRVDSLNPSSKNECCEVYLCEQQRSIEVCTSGPIMKGVTAHPFISCNRSTTCRRHVKGTNGGPKSCLCVYRTDRGWPKSREGYGHGVLIVVKPVNDRIMAKENRSFVSICEGGTADA